MPEYLAPGVYVEEVSFRAKSIEGVSTSTTAFVGPTRRGPLSGKLTDSTVLTPEVITSYGEFERVYGGLADLDFNGTAATNYMAHAVKSFFDNGGARLFVARTFAPKNNSVNASVAKSAVLIGANSNDPKDQVRFVARAPGSGLNSGVAALLKASKASQPIADKAPVGSLLTTGNADPLAQGNVVFRRAPDKWRGGQDGNTDLNLANAVAPQLLSMTLVVSDADGNAIIYDDLGFDPAHPRFIGDVLTANPSRKSEMLETPVYLEIGENVRKAADLALQLKQAFFSTSAQATFTLTGGDDGLEPDATAYQTALALLETIDDISIVAAPGHSTNSNFAAIQQALLTHVETQTKYRIAILDTPDGNTPGEALDVRSRMDSTHAALYYPWIVVANPAARPGNELIPKQVALPPSGFVAGIYARTDITRGVWKAPANEVVFGALRFERDITFGQQELLNPQGVNCLRSFYGRGNRVWGARTASSDPEWKYVNVRRYFNYLEHSIDRATQWAVFEPNGEALWANIRETVSAFLYNEWRSGALLGTKPEEAYFVRCDRSTMTQNDLDNGRLICLIGVAAIKPAEFVIFRIGQKTADARS